MIGEDAERANDAYRAVGRYVVEFSRLIAYMRVGMERHLAVGNDRTASALALGAAPAEQLTNSFFAICEYAARLEGEELKIGRRLRKETLDEVSRRNDFAHGDWLLESLDTAREHPQLSRVKPGRSKDRVQAKDLPISEIDAASNEVYALRQKVAEFSAICLDTHPFNIGQAARQIEVRHVLAMDGHAVKRVNPVLIKWL